MVLDGLEGRLEENYPLRSLNTWKIGGRGELVFWPQTTAALTEAWRRGKEAGIPLWLIGRGSNLLLPDDVLPGLTIVTTQMAGIHWGDCTLWAEAGYSLAKLAQETGEKGWSGLEFARGIPGTVGGALVMNAGAHGGEISELVRTVRILDTVKGVIRTLSREEIKFGYRESSLRDQDWILEAELVLAPGDREEIMAQMEANLARRKAGQPLNQPNAGSVFRNPPHDSAGRLIEAAGWKGKRQGGAQVSEKHANFIVNTGEATASDILTLVEKIQDDIKEKFGVMLETEVRCMAEEFQLSKDKID